MKKEKKNKLKKPKVKLPSYSAKSFITQLANSQQALVRETQSNEIVKDNRSLFFNNEYNKEKNDIFKWLKRD